VLCQLQLHFRRRTIKQLVLGSDPDVERVAASNQRTDFPNISCAAERFFTYLLTHNSTIKTSTNMIRNKFIAIIAVTCACSAVSSLNAATIPAGTTLAIQTVGSISSSDPVGKTFEAKLDQDVAVKGNVLLKAGTKAFGRIKSSRGGMSGRPEPFSVELTSISVNGSNVAVKTNSAEPGTRPGTARQARHGVTAGKLQISPGTKMQFQLTQAVSF
jgi:hypothetical protein